MRGKRYSEEFKIEVVKQVTDRGYKVLDVAESIGSDIQEPPQLDKTLRGPGQPAPNNSRPAGGDA